MTALDLKLLDHLLLCVVRNTALVEESMAQETSVSIDVHISAVETAEYTHNG
jgi:hypothetical protein